MRAFLISAAFGMVQALLLKFCLSCFMKGKRGRGVLLVLLKFILYIAAVGTVMQRYFFLLTTCACGFAAGFPFFGILLFCYMVFFKKKAD